MSSVEFSTDEECKATLELSPSWTAASEIRSSILSSLTVQTSSVLWLHWPLSKSRLCMWLIICTSMYGTWDIISIFSGDAVQNSKCHRTKWKDRQRLNNTTTSWSRVPWKPTAGCHGNQLMSDDTIGMATMWSWLKWQITGAGFHGKKETCPTGDTMKHRKLYILNLA